MTYSQVFNIINDELRLLSDDADFNLDHIEFLCSKWRAYLIQTDNLNKKIISSLGYDSPLYQQLCINLIETTPSDTSYSCDGGNVLRSTTKIPERLDDNLKIDLLNFFKGTNIIYINTPERFKYQGCNKWMKNLIYASVLPDGYLYLKSSNPNFLNLQKIKITAIYQNIDDAKELLCDKTGSTCKYMDSEYPLSEYQLPALIQYVVNELSQSIYKPKDNNNNSNEDLSKYMQVKQQQEQQKQQE